MPLTAGSLDIHKLALQLSEGLTRKNSAPKLAEAGEACTFQVTATKTPSPAFD